MRESSRKLYDAVTEAIGGATPTKEQSILLRRIEVDYYNDYFGVPDMPQHALAAKLQEVGLNQLVPRVIAGDFDGIRAEADEWMASPEGRGARAELGL